MTKHQFSIPDGRLLTSVVMDEGEFSGLCDLIEKIIAEAPPANAATGKRMSPGDVGRIREAKHVPMMARGTLTEEVFDHYAIGTDLATFIVRGQGMAVFDRHLSN